MRFDEYGLIRMEHDTDLQGSIGDSCAETGRYISLWGPPFGMTVTNYASSTQTVNHKRAIRHPLSIDPSFGPDQFVPRKLVTGSNLGMVWYSIECLAARLPKAAPLLLLVLELGLRLPFQYDSGLKRFKSTRQYANCGDYLNFILLSVTLKVRPRIIQMAEAYKAVNAYYEPESQNGYWIFNDLYQKGIEGLYENTRNDISLPSRILNRVFNCLLPRK